MKSPHAGLIAVVALAGCAAVPMGDSKRDAELKSFTVVQDRAGIYVYRNESLGAGVKMDISIDGKIVGQSAAKTYFYQEVSPGKHTVASTAENTDTLEVDVRPGTLAFIWQEVKMGLLYARTRLHLVSEDEGRKGVLASRLAASR